MEMNKADDWIISSEEIILDVMLTNGKFADIYKARYQPFKNYTKRNVVAKTLKSNNQYIQCFTNCKILVNPLTLYILFFSKVVTLKKIC